MLPVSISVETDISRLNGACHGPAPAPSRPAAGEFPVFRM